MSKENVFVLESFIAYMEEQGLSRETIKSYAGNVERYFRWCKESFGKSPTRSTAPMYGISNPIC